MDLKIQTVESGRLPAAMALVRRVFLEFEAPDYSAEGVAFFLDYIATSDMEQRIMSGEICVWCALLGDAVVGVVALRPPCAVSLLFVDKDHHRKGIAKRLLAHALTEYRCDACAVTVNSSPYAVEAYRRMGFREAGPEQTVSGVRFLPMVLKGPAPSDNKGGSHMDCLFCKIIGGDIPSNKLYEDDKVLAFYDIEPQAPVHFLVIPKTHISGADKLDEQNADIVGHIFAVIAKLAAQLELSGGYRVVNNCGKDAAQSVPHLHFHVLAGRPLAWPPG